MVADGQTRCYESVQRASGGMMQKSSRSKFDNGDMELVKTGLFSKVNYLILYLSLVACFIQLS